MTRTRVINLRNKTLMFTSITSFKNIFPFFCFFFKEFMKLFGSGAIGSKMLLVTNASWILDYWNVSSSSSTKNSPRTTNGYKCRNLQLYKVPSTTNFKMILVLATFPSFYYLVFLLLSFPHN